MNERQMKTCPKEMLFVGLTCLNFRAARNIVRKMLNTNNEFVPNLKIEK